MQYYQLTKQGERDHNEDFIGMATRDNRVIFILADGLGGHGKGEVASKTVVESVKEYYEHAEELPELSHCIEYAQSKLMEKQVKERATYGMKTTLVVVEIDGGKARFAHVGDSRAYLFNRGREIEHTLDHSVPQMLVVSGKIKERDIRFHDDRNRLLRVMGIKWDRPMYEVGEWFEISNRDSFLLCSDGFWEWIDEKHMEKCYKRTSSPEEWLNLMEKEICDSGKGKDMDNYSAIVVDFRDDI